MSCRIKLLKLKSEVQASCSYCLQSSDSLLLLCINCFPRGCLKSQELVILAGKQEAQESLSSSPRVDCYTQDANT